MKQVFIILLCLPACIPGITQPVLTFTPLSFSGPSLDEPVDITGCGDGSGRLFIVEKRGTIRIVDDGEVLSDFFLNIQGRVHNEGERGLLGLAFHPQYPTVPYFYVNYVRQGTIISCISRFQVNPDNPNDALEDSELILIEQPGVEGNHKAGDLVFGPDGYLYIGMGDGGGSNDPQNNGQDISTLLGKILRINVDVEDPPLPYSIPPDNPYVNGPGLPEIWAIGLRNPWRISFDRLTADFWVGDVGQADWEEVSMVPFGTGGEINFGWDCYEGTHEFETENCPANPEITWPVFEYSHNECNPCPNGRGNCVTGGFVYRGTTFPAIQGCYIMADFVSNYIWLLRPSEATSGEYDVFVQNGQGMVSSISTFGEDDNGELYAASLGGTIYTVSGEEVLPVQWVSVKAKRIAEGNLIEWIMHDSNDVDRFEIHRADSPLFDQVSVAGSVSPVEDKIHYQFIDPDFSEKITYYRIGAISKEGVTDFSPITWVREGDPGPSPFLAYDPDRSTWTIQLPADWQTGDLTVFDLQGKEVWSNRLQWVAQVEIAIPEIPGVYYVQITGLTGKWSGQVVRL
jgi:glucose/arabinose dehydrogenase